MFETTCRGCKAQINFIQTAKNNKWVPVDFKPKRIHPGDKGIYYLEDGRAVNAEKITEDQWGYTTHFATCPKSKDFRKQKGPSETPS